MRQRAELDEKRGRDFRHEQRMSHQARAEERDDAGGGAEQTPVRLRGFRASADSAAERKTERAGEERRVDEEADDAFFGRDLQEVVVRVFRAVDPRAVASGSWASRGSSGRGEVEIRVRADHAKARHHELLPEAGAAVGGIALDLDVRERGRPRSNTPNTPPIDWRSAGARGHPSNVVAQRNASGMTRPAARLGAARTAHPQTAPHAADAKIQKARRRPRSRIASPSARQRTIAKCDAGGVDVDDVRGKTVTDRGLAREDLLGPDAEPQQHARDRRRESPTVASATGSDRASDGRERSASMAAATSAKPSIIRAASLMPVGSP